VRDEICKGRSRYYREKSNIRPARFWSAVPSNGCSCLGGGKKKKGSLDQDLAAAPKAGDESFGLGEKGGVGGLSEGGRLGNRK